MPEETPRDGENQQGSKYNPEDLEGAKKIIIALEKRLNERDEEIGALKGRVSEFAERVTAIEAGQKQRLEQEGNYRELSQKYLADLEAVKPMAERAQALEAIIRESNEARISRVPEQQRALVPADYPPEKLQAWLNANESLLMKPPAPDYNAGAGAEGASRSKPQLTEEQRQAAKRFGMTEEQYAVQLQKSQTEQ